MGVVSEELNGKSLSCGHSFHGFRAFDSGLARLVEGVVGQAGRQNEPGDGSKKPPAAFCNLKKLLKTST